MRPEPNDSDQHTDAMGPFLDVTLADGGILRLRIAGVGSRSYAFLIDWHLKLLMSLAWLLAWFIVMAALDGGGEPPGLARQDLWVIYTLLLPVAAIYLGYQPVLEIIGHGRSPGKRIAGIRIVTRHGLTPSGGALLIRNLFRVVDALPGVYLVGLLTALLTPQQVRLGDLVAGTVLVFDTTAGPMRGDPFAVWDADRLTPSDHELAQELLARWRGLNRGQRIRLASRLLAQYGFEVTGLGDRALRDRVRSLIEGSPRE